MKKILLSSLMILSFILFSISCSNDDNSNETTPIETEKTINYKTFNKERIAFSDEFGQISTKSFNLPEDVDKVKAIKMFLQLT